MKRGYFGIGVQNLKNQLNLGTLWRSAFNFEADFIFTTGKRYQIQSSDTLKSMRHIPFFEYDSIEDLQIPRDCQIVGVEITANAHDLSNFVHPERAIYLLGAEDNGLTENAIDVCHQIVKITSNRCLNVAVAGAIVMYDRSVKMTRNKNG